MTMREKIARAIHNISPDYDVPWDEMHDGIKSLFLADADAALAAMEKPTREMWAAGGDKVVNNRKWHHDKLLTEVWNAMIQAAKGGGA